jgi:azurin
MKISGTNALIQVWHVSFGLFVACTSLVVENSSFAADAKPLIVNIASKGDELVYDKTQIKAKVNQPIKLTFTNKASKGSGLQHNWVLTNPGTADQVGQASMMVGPDQNYIAKSSDILIHTKLLQPGEKETLEFKAPAKAGSYPYICTFPGHYTMMKGTLEVK